jgi:Major Facilitator Superfamily
VTAAGATPAKTKATSVVLLTLAMGQFLMTLDTSVMNVSIATVAKDVGTTVTGIQGAITAYTLVMASLMIIGAKIGAIIGRKRAFAIGCVIYGCGSFTTSIAPNLPVLLFGWSFLEGVGRRADPPGDRRAGGRELPGRASAGRVRARRRCGRDRRRGRPAHRRDLHDVLLVAVGVCRRGADRDRDPDPQPQDRRRPAGDTAEAGFRRRGALRSGPRAARLRRAALR